MQKNDDNLSCKNTFWKKHPTFTTGFCAFCVISACIILYFIILRIDKINAVIVRFFDIIEPVTYGIAMAFLLNPIMQRIENLLFKISKKSKNKSKTSLIRGISITITIILTMFIIYLVASFVFPELISSIENIIETLPHKIEYLNNYADKIIQSNKFISENVDRLITYINDHISQWVKTTLPEKLNIYINYVTSSLTKIADILFNLVIGLACSIYFLYNKEKFIAQFKKVLFAFLKPKKAKNTISLSKESFDIFTHSIIGKIVDSIILGFICFTAMILFKMPYPVLISFIIGTTNFIPLFGPWIGGLPCGALIMLTEPSQTIYFGILILCLQQLDANFLTPKIVGNYIGIPAFWVIVSCLIGGGLFGVLGLIMCVPVFGILYHLFSRLIVRKLKERKLPHLTKDYTIDKLEKEKVKKEEEEIKS